jgi:hypothetical protein
MHYRKMLYAALLGLLLLLGLLGLPGQGSAQEPVTVTFAPVEVGVAETALLEARIDCPPGRCGSFHIILSFDRSLIRIKRAALGPYLGDQAFEAENRIDNPAGKVELAAESVAPPADADSLLFTLEVYGLVPGTSPITVEALEIYDVTRLTVDSAAAEESVTIFETGKIAFFSPPSDEWEVAFVSDRDGNPEIYAMSADGSTVRRLTEHEMLDGGPQWSPDGSRIAFFSARDGNLEIYVMDENGGNLRRLTENDAPDYNPAWAPDGTQIVFVSERDGSPDLYVMPAAGGESDVRRLTRPGIEMAPAWSPDGRGSRTMRCPSPGCWQLFLMNADGSNRAGNRSVRRGRGAIGRPAGPTEPDCRAWLAACIPSGAMGPIPQLPPGWLTETAFAPMAGSHTWLDTAVQRSVRHRRQAPYFPPDRN